MIWQRTSVNRRVVGSSPTRGAMKPPLTGFLLPAEAAGRGRPAVNGACGARRSGPHVGDFGGQLRRNGRQWLVVEHHDVEHEKRRLGCQAGHEHERVCLGCAERRSFSRTRGARGLVLKNSLSHSASASPAAAKRRPREGERLPPRASRFDSPACRRSGRCEPAAPAPTRDAGRPGRPRRRRRRHGLRAAQSSRGDSRGCRSARMARSWTREPHGPRPGAASGGRRTPEADQAASTAPFHRGVDQGDERLDVAVSERLERGTDRADAHAARLPPAQPPSKRSAGALIRH